MWHGVVYQNRMEVYNLGNYFSDDYFGSIFGDILNIKSKSEQEKILDDYWSHSKVKEYYRYINEIKKYGMRVFRNSDGKHKIK